MIVIYGWAAKRAFVRLLNYLLGTEMFVIILLTLIEVFTLVKFVIFETVCIENKQCVLLFKKNLQR